MKTPSRNNLWALIAVVAVAVVTDWAVHRFHRPGQIDVISAQAMDMSAMRPPTGAAPVALAAVRRGGLSDTVTYTGSVAALNEQDISPRITGRLLSLSVYPGDPVRAGQVVAQLDTSQVGPQAAQAAAQAQQAQIGADVAQLTHHLHHQAALDQAYAQVQAAVQGVADAQADAQADTGAVAEAQAGAQSAQASADYWKTELAREKQLADAGAASQQEYQNELAQAQAAFAAVTQAQAKIRQAEATARASHGKIAEARRQVDVARAGVRMAQADLAVAQGQATQARAGAAAARAAAQQANAAQGYARLVSPANGVVTERPFAPGTLVQPGTVILRIAEIDRVRVQAHVAVEDIAGIHIGSPVTVAVQGVGSAHPMAARVTSVFPAANAETHTAIVEAVVPNPVHRLLPGAFVTMQIAKGGVSDGLLVPASAIVSQGGQSFVWTTGGASAESVYECVICHIHYTAAQAARFHYCDPMEGGKLVPLKNASSAVPPGSLTAHQVAVQVGASDGDWTEITASGLTLGTRVVTHGQAGLTEGARIAATAWGLDGPQTLPTAASANGGQTLYRCEKCGMTYSAADAARNHYIDPMDGGKLLPVRSR